MVKVQLGAGNALPTRVGALTLLAGESFLKSAILDNINEYVYFGTETAPGIVVKVDISGALPTRIGNLVLDYGAGENSLDSAAIDVAAGSGYFGCFSQPGESTTFLGL